MGGLRADADDGGGLAKSARARPASARAHTGLAGRWLARRGRRLGCWETGREMKRWPVGGDRSRAGLLSPAVWV
jgi:hypothetical protein